MCRCACVCRCRCPCIHVWKPKVYVMCLPWSCSPFLTGSLNELRAHWGGQHDCWVNPYQLTISVPHIPALGLHTCTPHLSLCGHWGSEVSSCLYSKHTNHGAMSCSELVFLMHRFQNLFPLVLNSARKQRVGVMENGFPGLNHFQTPPRSDKFLSNWK